MNHSVPNTTANASGGRARKKDSSVICDGCAAIAARLRSSAAVTSTVVVMRASGTPEVELLGVGALHVGRDLVGEAIGQAEEVLPARRRRVDAWRARERGGAATDDVHLDVIGVAVAAALVVHGEHVGALFAQELGEVRRGLFHVGGRERVGGVVGGLTGHARVVVREELDAGGAEHRGRGTRFLLASLAERLVGFEHAVGDLAEIATGPEHEHDAVTGVGGDRERAADGDGFVVGMRVERDDRGGHPAMVARARAKWQWR